jgi:hypothetical protein
MPTPTFNVTPWLFTFPHPRHWLERTHEKHTWILIKHCFLKRFKNQVFDPYTHPPVDRILDMSLKIYLLKHCSNIKLYVTMSPTELFCYIFWNQYLTVLKCDWLRPLHFSVGASTMPERQFQRPKMISSLATIYIAERLSKIAESAYISSCIYTV